MKATTVGIMILVGVLCGTRAIYGQATVLICNLERPLTSDCDGVLPLPDGAVVSIYHDQNANGPDPNDESPFMDFVMNGEAIYGIPGVFCTEPDLFIDATFPHPWRFYVRVLVCDHDAMWTSETFTVVDGPQAVNLVNWFCEPCTVAQPIGAVVLRNETTVLTQFCFGGPPLPDGTEVSIYWDANSNGPDSTDALAVFGDCPTCVPYSSFLMNGEALLGQAGLFYMEQSIVVDSTHSSPWLFYLRVPLCDHDVMWTSDTFRVIEGYQEISVETWGCDLCPIIDDIPDAAIPVVNAVTLHPNYPNPFNPSTEITFDLPREMNVNLIVYDVLGREVAELASGMMNAGEHTVTFEASLLSSGVYLYRLQAGAFVETRKMVLMK